MRGNTVLCLIPLIHLYYLPHLDSWHGDAIPAIRLSSYIVGPHGALPLLFILETVLNVERTTDQHQSTIILIKHNIFGLRDQHIPLAL